MTEESNDLFSFKLASCVESGIQYSNILSVLFDNIAWLKNPDLLLFPSIFIMMKWRRKYKGERTYQDKSRFPCETRLIYLFCCFDSCCQYLLEANASSDMEIWRGWWTIPPVHWSSFGCRSEYSPCGAGEGELVMPSYWRWAKSSREVPFKWVHSKSLLASLNGLEGQQLGLYPVKIYLGIK